MSRTSVIRIFTTIKEHKKKTAFGLACCSYLAYYLKNKEKENNIFREYCAKAKNIGDETLTSASRPKRITVLLNTFAKNGKCKYDFEKYALPLLNLAGLEVTIIKPEDSKQLRSISAVLDRQETDGVYVVGGDGTVSHVVTGMMELVNTNMKLTKAPNFAQMPPPFGVFPGGFENVFVKQIFPFVDEKIRWYAENAMSIINGVVKNCGLVEIQLDDKEPVYAAQYLHLGSFQSVDSKKFKYWYWGSLKHKFAYFWNGIKQKPLIIDVNLSYVEPCTGCSKCFVRPRENTVKRTWWQSLLGLSKPNRLSSGPDLSQVVNENCGAAIENDVKTVEIFINADRNENSTSLDVFVGPDELGRLGFAKEGWRREKSINVGLAPSVEFQAAKVSARELAISQPLPGKTSDQTEQHAPEPLVISIDGDSQEFVEKATIKVIPNAVQCFIPAAR